ncbi:hypothetical protein [Listeria aquatica]|uniref:Uncharacterized protein n=1 Tax=Listeria aquatica FSL S10-1188 TaxID=1265818 RepID=W7B3T0_9LIST|nr:hypothetical protein [Listeria aquatica]EUJ17396.1 hypothetical protein MAQA_12946 [Listeria aquatica FSL S10-1188]
MTNETSAIVDGNGSFSRFYITLNAFFNQETGGKLWKFSVLEKWSLLIGVLTSMAIFLMRN